MVGLQGSTATTNKEPMASPSGDVRGALPAWVTCDFQCQNCSQGAGCVIKQIVEIRAAVAAGQGTAVPMGQGTGAVAGQPCVAAGQGTAVPMGQGAEVVAGQSYAAAGQAVDAAAQVGVAAGGRNIVSLYGENEDESDCFFEPVLKEKMKEKEKKKKQKENKKKATRGKSAAAAANAREAKNLGFTKDCDDDDDDESDDLRRCESCPDRNDCLPNSMQECPVCSRREQNVDWFLPYWNAQRIKHNARVQALPFLTKKQVTMLKSRQAKYGRAALRVFVDNIMTSDYINGRKGKPAPSHLDYYLDKMRFPRVVQGAYNDLEPEERKPTAEEQRAQMAAEREEARQQRLREAREEDERKHEQMEKERERWAREAATPEQIEEIKKRNDIFRILSQSVGKQKGALE